MLLGYVGSEGLVIKIIVRVRRIREKLGAPLQRYIFVVRIGRGGVLGFAGGYPFAPAREDG